VTALIGNGYAGRLQQVLGDPAAATIFLPRGKKMASHDRWIAFTGKPRGRIVIDDGACAALGHKGRSLLPAGIRSCSGAFAEGDPVEIVDGGGKVIARGLVNYSASELTRIKGLRTGEIAARLGRKLYDEAVHRDNLVLL
jgi:glutamate 5-kinase